MEKNRITTQFSHKVTIVSFILAVFVMYIHAKNTAYYSFQGVDATPIYTLNQILSETFGRIGVPFFFIQSGYWMFRFDIQQADFKVWKQKLKKKFTTLIVPYLLWNAYSIVVFMFLTNLPGRAFYLNEGQVVTFSFQTLYEGLILCKYNYPYWFMSDLIIITILSPLLSFFLKKKIIAVITWIILMILTILNLNIPFFQTSSVMLFFMGGILSAYFKEFWETQNSDMKCIVIYTVLFILLCVCKWIDIPYISTLYVIAAPILFWKICDVLVIFHLFDNEPVWFIKQSFFIYSAHVFVVEGYSSICARINQSMLWICITYVLNPLITLLILYVLARFLYSRLPGFYNLICGNRS